MQTQEVLTYLIQQSVNYGTGRNTLAFVSLKYNEGIILLSRHKKGLLKLQVLVLGTKTQVTKACYK